MVNSPVTHCGGVFSFLHIADLDNRRVFRYGARQRFSAHKERVNYPNKEEVVGEVDGKTLVSIEGLSKKVESRIGRPVPDIEDICGSDFSCFSEGVTIGDVMVAIRRIVVNAKTDCDRRFNSKEWWVKDADQAADLIVDLGRDIATPHQDNESLDAAYYYILKGLHGFLSSGSGYPLGPYALMRIGHLTDVIGELKWHKLTAEDLKALSGKVHGLNRDAKLTLGKCAVCFFPTSPWQAAMLSPDVESKDGTKEERFELLKILRDRHQVDDTFFRTDDEVKECLREARERISSRTSRNDRFDSAFRKVLVELGGKEGAEIDFQHQGDLGCVSDKYIVSAAEGPVPGSIAIVVIPSSSNLASQLGKTMSISLIMMGGKKHRS